MTKYHTIEGIMGPNSLMVVYVDPLGKPDMEISANWLRTSEPSGRVKLWPSGLNAHAVLSLVSSGHLQNGLHQNTSANPESCCWVGV